MILLWFFDVLIWIFDGFMSYTIGPLPTQVTNLLTYIFQILDSGFSFVFLVLCDKNLVISIVTWIMTVSVTLFGMDTAWKVIHMIKLSHKHQEPCIIE